MKRAGRRDTVIAHCTAGLIRTPSSTSPETQMVTSGTVIQIESDRTVVELQEDAHCGRCSAFMCVGCRRPRIELRSVSGVSVGDRVEVEVPFSRFKAVLSVFLLPLLAVVAGAALGNYLTATSLPHTRYPNLLPILLAFLFVGLSFAGVHVYERTVGRRRKQPFIRRDD